MSVNINTGFRPILNQGFQFKASEPAAAGQKPQTFQAVPVAVGTATQLNSIQLSAVTPLSGQGQAQLVQAGQAESQNGSLNTSGLTVRYSWFAFGSVQDFFA